MRTSILLGLCIGALTWISIIAIIWGGYGIYIDKRKTLGLIHEGMNSTDLLWRRYWELKRRETLYPWFSRLESIQILLSIMKQAK